MFGCKKKIDNRPGEPLKYSKLITHKNLPKLCRQKVLHTMAIKSN